ncbi:MAG: helix-turn-helix transcriptional regulator [Magnetococcales bacterium]|nr:helix-turn-helix transcriptional regulator [Magnetococcales bacterium]
MFYVEVAPAARTKPLPGSIDIDDLVAEFEKQSPESAAAIALGRKRVADTFYADRPGIAQLRLQKGLSQAGLARKAKTSQSYIARLEHGKIDPHFSTARKIAEALEVSMELFQQALAGRTKP